MSDKARRGRPRLPGNESKAPTITLSFNDDAQRERFDAKAKKAGMTPREYGERIIKARADK